jgi:hypothetical protein
LHDGAANDLDGLIATMFPDPASLLRPERAVTEPVLGNLAGPGSSQPLG